ncbi:hypothetical protein ACP4OV_025273 [Aristida adscensionis]
MDLHGMRRPGWRRARPASRPAGEHALVAAAAAGAGTARAGGSAARRTGSPPAISRDTTPSHRRRGCHDIAPRVAPFLHRSLREHGGRPCVSWYGPMPKVTILDPEVTREVMANKSGHFERLKFPALYKTLGGGGGGHDGEEWVWRRRILNPRMLPAFSSCCEEMVSRWVGFLDSDGSCELDVWPELQNLTGDVISRTAFSSSYLEGRKIFMLQAEQVERFMTNLGKIVIPGYMSLPTKNNRELRRASREVESILRDLIGKRIQAMKEGESTEDDLLGLLLESNMRHTDANSQSGMGMTIEDRWQDRAREEVLHLFGRNKPEYEGLNHLKTVTMIIYEVLRLYPPGILFVRKTNKDMEIRGVTYPAGVIIEMPVLFIHHDPNIWGK